MHRMMAKDPQMRYQNARDLLADLSELAFRFQLKRAQSNDVVAMPTGNDGLHRLQLHLPWMLAAVLILMVGGYLELQSTATRDAFVIEGPSNVIRTRTADSIQGTSSAEAVDDQPAIAEAGVVDAASSESATVTSIADSASSMEEVESPRSMTNRSPQNELLSDATTTDDFTSERDSLSETAARPPRFGPQLPGSEFLLPGATDSPFTIQPDGLFGPYLPRDLFADSERTPGTMAPPSSGADGTDTDLSEIPAADSGTQPSSASDLPPPQTVRVVAPGLLAFARRVDEVDRDTDGAVLAATLENAIDLATRFGVIRVEFATPQLVTGPL